MPNVGILGEAVMFKLIQSLLVVAMLFVAVGASASDGVFKRKAASVAKHKEQKLAAKKAGKKDEKPKDTVTNVLESDGVTYECTFSENNAKNIHQESCVRKSDKGDNSADVLRRLGETCRWLVNEDTGPVVKDCKLRLFFPSNVESAITSGSDMLVYEDKIIVTVLSGECPTKQPPAELADKFADGRAYLVHHLDFIVNSYMIAVKGDVSPIEAEKQAAEEEAERQKNDWSDRDAFIYVLPNDMTPKQLAEFLEAHYATSDSVTNCENFGAEYKAQILSLRAAPEGNTKPFPVLWHSIVYHPEVESAREKHFITGEFLNPELAREQLGSAHRYNPYLCKQNNDDELDGARMPLPRAKEIHQRFQIDGPELPSLFRANEGVWVIGKTVAGERTSARRRNLPVRNP